MSEQSYFDEYESMLDGFYDPPPDDKWAAEGRQLVKEMWMFLQRSNVDPAEWSHFPHGMHDLLFSPRSLPSGVWGRPLTDEELVAAMKQSAFVLRDLIDRLDLDRSGLTIAAQLDAFEEQEPGLVDPRERTGSKSKLIEAHQALIRYRTSGRDILDRERDFQDCVNALWTALDRMRAELTSRTRLPKVDTSVRTAVSAWWKSTLWPVIEADPLIKWVRDARSMDNHIEHQTRALGIVGSFEARDIDLDSPGRQRVSLTGHVFEVLNPDTDRELEVLVGRLPTVVDTLDFVAVNPPASHNGAPLSDQSVPALLSAAIDYVTDVFVLVRRPLSVIARDGGQP